MEIRINISNEQFQELEKAATLAGITVNQLAKSRVTNTDKPNKLLSELIDKALKHEPNRPFTLMSLVDQEEWRSLSINVRLSVGTSFCRMVDKGQLPGISKAEKNSSKVQQYIKL